MSNSPPDRALPRSPGTLVPLSPGFRSCFSFSRSFLALFRAFFSPFVSAEEHGAATGAGASQLRPSTSRTAEMTLQQACCSHSEVAANVEIGVVSSCERRLR